MKLREYQRLVWYFESIEARAKRGEILPSDIPALKELETRFKALLVQCKLAGLKNHKPKSSSK